MFLRSNLSPRSEHCAVANQKQEMEETMGEGEAPVGSPWH